MIRLVGTLVVIATIATAGLLVYLLQPRVGLVLGFAVAAAYILLAAPVAPLAMRFDEIRDRRESLRFVQGFEDAAIGMAILTPELELTRVNDTLARMLGRPIEDVQGHCILEFTHPDDVTMSQKAVDGVEGGDQTSFVKRYLRPDQSTVDATVQTVFVRPDHGEPYFFSQLIDVTEQRRAELQKAAIAELGRRALRWSDAITTMNEALEIAKRILDADRCAVTRMTPDGDFRVAAGTGDIPGPYDVLKGSASQSGYTLAEDAPVVCNDLLAEERFLVPTFAVERKMRRSISVPVPERGGARHVLLVHAHEGPREFGVADVRFVEALANVIAGALDRSATEYELRRRALADPLTGLANRALLMSQLERELRHAVRMHARVCILMLDLDRFKFVNDTLGHEMGDALLRQVAGRLTACVRDEDLVARVGGDEFVVISTRMDSERAVAEVGHRIVETLSKPFEVSGHEVVTSASVGVAVAETGEESASDLVRDADSAMYRAKEMGGGRLELFDLGLRERLLERASIEHDLRHALERDELELHYQPLVDLTSARTVGFEALLRWRHPERGLVPPNDFISIAEETGLIIPIGSWVLRAACAQLARWEEPVYLSANLSALQVVPDLVDEVEGLLERYMLRPARLVLEITESLVLDPLTKPTVARLRALGVQVALDDFGTGYSSLGSLQRFPLDVVKLDRELIKSLDEESGSAVLAAAVELGRALGLNVVAEGIETQLQLAKVRELGCDLGQGFLFAKPLPVQEADRFLRGLDAADAA
ncbi:MAG: EAL domain-containing protein [Thermoleophilaceae bacterium]